MFAHACERACACVCERGGGERGREGVNDRQRMEGERMHSLEMHVKSY